MRTFPRKRRPYSPRARSAQFQRGHVAQEPQQLSLQRLNSSKKALWPKEPVQLRQNRQRSPNSSVFRASIAQRRPCSPGASLTQFQRGHVAQLSLQSLNYSKKALWPKEPVQLRQNSQRSPNSSVFRASTAQRRPCSLKASSAQFQRGLVAQEP